MLSLTKRKPQVIFASIIFVVVVDQISKYLFAGFGSFLCNRGGPFGLDFKPLVISVLTLSLFVYLLRKENRNNNVFGYSLLIAGGASNLIDRFLLGCVRDFISVTHLFPTFNLADTAITLGVLVVLWEAFASRNKRDET